MTKRKADEINDPFIDRLRRLFEQLNTLATFMYFRKLTLSIDSFSKASQCKPEEIEYLAFIYPEMIKIENGLIILKIKGPKKTMNVAMKGRLDDFNSKLYALKKDDLKVFLDDFLSDQIKSTIYAKSPFKNERIEMDPPRCLLKFLKDLANASFYKGQMSEIATEKGLDPEYGVVDNSWPKSILPLFPLYSHQVTGLGYVQKGHHVMVASKTSSGKSLIYQLPILKGITDSTEFKSLLIFPTKALAQDQKLSLEKILSKHIESDVLVNIFDGDTEKNNRAMIRESSQIVFTNPDMLHVSILPNHNLWKHFFVRLKVVVVDELHTYSGSFGLHCAYVMRRMLRICNYYGNYSVQFVCCSATISNPKEHMEAFFNIKDVKVVDFNTAPCGTRYHVAWSPPLRDLNNANRGYRTPIEETVNLIVHMMYKNVRTICFVHSRNECEVILKETKLLLERIAPSLADRLQAYRGGYSIQDRRYIESQLFRGELLCVVATNALELGIDIGSLDCVINMGFPGLAQYRQQSGRAGRRERDSLSILVARTHNSSDQYYAKNPKNLIENELQRLFLDFSNQSILQLHLQCAASEIRFDVSSDSAYFGDSVTVEELCEWHLQNDHQFNVFYSAKKYNGSPAISVNIRQIDEDAYRVIDSYNNLELERVERHRALFSIYEDAIFIYQGHSYIIYKVDRERLIAMAKPVECDYITVPWDRSTVVPTKIASERTWIDSPRMIVNFGTVEIKTVIFGYKKIDPLTRHTRDKVVGIETSYNHKGYGMWIDVPLSIIQNLSSLSIDCEASIHGCIHLLASIIPIYVELPQNMLRCDCHGGTMQHIMIYASESLKYMFENIADLMYEIIFRSFQVLNTCSCENGCMGCLHWDNCIYLNPIMDKKGSIKLLGALLSKTF